MRTDLSAFPRGVADPLCPRGHVITTSTDRRLLWHVEADLAVSGTTDEMRELGVAIRRYLHETCEHHWHNYAADPEIPAHRQCLWCNDVEFRPDAPTAADVRADPEYWISGDGSEVARRTRCAHDYFLTDSCPGCDADEEVS